MINQTTLNKKWTIKPLGEVVDFLDNLRKPIKASERVEGDYPYYGANGIQGFVNDYIFDEPLILLAEDGGHFGNPNKKIAYKIKGKTWVNNHAHVLRPKDGINLDFLCRQLEKYDPAKYISGSTRPKLTKTNAMLIPVAVPDMSVQVKIKSILNNAEYLVEKRKKSIALLDDFIKSTFLEMFDNSTVDRKNWEDTKLGQVCNILSGATPNTKVDDNWNGDIDWVTPAELNNDNYYYQNSKRKLTEQGLKSCSAKLFPKGTVMLTSRAPIGKVAIAGKEMCTNQGFKNLIPSKKIDSNYLYFWLKMKNDFLNSLGRGATFKEISKTIVSNISIELPPIKIQKKFADIVKQTELLKTKYKESEKELNNLFGSLMHRAFNGEL